MNDNIPIVEPTIDYTQVPPIHQKRTVSFINYFIVTTVSFLNKFALNCEEKLYEFENKLQKLEAAVVILESRLASVPGLDEKSTPELVINVEPEKNQTNEPVKEETPVDIDEPDQTEAEKPPEEAPNTQPICKHPLYEKYFKMVNFGVPKPAVKLKMVQEGLDPELLDNPQHLVPKDTSEA